MSAPETLKAGGSNRRISGRSNLASAKLQDYVGIGQVNPEPFRTSRRAVIDALLQHLAMSRSNLALATGLSRSAITEVSQHLIDLGLLEEKTVVSAQQGRG